jgi:hypothetical protein
LNGAPAHFRGMVGNYDKRFQGMSFRLDVGAF